MTAPLKLGILGLGRWGTHLLRTFLALPEAQVMAIADPHPQRLGAIQSRFALPLVQCFVTGEAAIAGLELDAVVIATPASTHGQLIQLALERGLHVLCEKPMTLDSVTGATLVRLAADRRRQLMVDHTYLFHPAVQRGRQFCQQMTDHGWRYGCATRTHLGPVRQDADVFWDLAIHDVAIFNYWLGQAPLTVMAWGQTWLQPQAQKNFSGGLKDVGWIRLTYGAGVEVLIHASWLNVTRQRRLDLVGDQGTLVLDELSPRGLLTWQPGQVIAQSGEFVPMVQDYQVFAIEPVEPLAQMAKHFLHCALTNSPSTMASGEAAMVLVNLMEAIQKAAATGQMVVL